MCSCLGFHYLIHQVIHLFVYTTLKSIWDVCSSVVFLEENDISYFLNLSQVCPKGSLSYFLNVQSTQNLLVVQNKYWNVNIYFISFSFWLTSVYTSGEWSALIYLSQTNMQSWQSYFPSDCYTFLQKLPNVTFNYLPHCAERLLTNCIQAWQLLHRIFSINFFMPNMFRKVYKAFSTEFFYLFYIRIKRSVCFVDVEIHCFDLLNDSFDDNIKLNTGCVIGLT